MQKGHLLEFSCLSCDMAVQFSIFSLIRQDHQIHCEQCQKEYLFNDKTLLRQLTKFEKLCIQIQESEEILGMTSVGVNVGNHHVSIPYKLLLTRLNSHLELELGGKPCKISFRIEPVLDIKPQLKEPQELLI